MADGQFHNTGGRPAHRSSSSISLAQSSYSPIAGQPSRNKLIVFADGTYLELFNWIDDAPHANAWADRTPGLIDFALTTLPPSTPESLHAEIEARFKQSEDVGFVDFKFTDPEAGGRTRNDGVAVKWKLSRPVHVPNALSLPGTVSGSGHRKDLPFFTHDVTARNVRVPFEDTEKTTHPCGATGISAIKMVIPISRYTEYIRLYERLLGVPAKASSGELCHSFEVGSPVEGANRSRISTFAERDDGGNVTQQDRHLGIYGLRLFTKQREGHRPQALGVDGVAAAVSLE